VPDSTAEIHTKREGFDGAKVLSVESLGGIMIAIKKLLVPTDFSEYSQFALKYAAAFAEGFTAKVYVMHVHEPYPQGAVFEGMVYDSELVAKAEAKARGDLDAVVAQLTARQIQAEPVFATGRPYIQIVRQAEKLEVDLIVLATHGRRGVSHLVFGSNAEKIVRLSPCPVLTVKHPEHEFVG
jgi:nucleotide-binding universal stress UspA family protein